jgi:hypothetical protein
MYLSALPSKADLRYQNQKKMDQAEEPLVHHVGHGMAAKVFAKDFHENNFGKEHTSK